MSTRSFIGILGEDETIQAVYCHSDGYPTYNGKMLRDHYRDARKIAELMKLGDLSQLSQEIGEKHPFSPDWDSAPAGQSMQAYDAYDAKYGHMCKAYGRDRGETDVAAKTYDTLEEFLDGARNHDAEYAYLYREGGWVAWDLHQSSKMWQGAMPIRKAIRSYEAHSEK